MKYNPDDLVEMEPVEEGNREFVVVNATEAVSKSGGNPMMELELQVEAGRDKPLTVFDRLVNTPKSLWVLKNFCEAVSPRIDFQAGELLPANVIGVTGKAHLVLGEENAKGKRFMQVDHYIIPSRSQVDTGSSVDSQTVEPDQRVSSDSSQAAIPF